MSTINGMISEMKKLGILNNKRVIDSYTNEDELLDGMFITVITAEDSHVYYKTTYFYSYVSHDYKFITVNGCM